MGALSTHPHGSFGPSGKRGSYGYDAQNTLRMPQWWCVRHRAHGRRMTYARCHHDQRHGLPWRNEQRRSPQIEQCGTNARSRHTIHQKTRAMTQMLVTLKIQLISPAGIGAPKRARKSARRLRSSGTVGSPMSAVKPRSCSRHVSRNTSAEPSKPS